MAILYGTIIFLAIGAFVYSQPVWYALMCRMATRNISKTILAINEASFFIYLCIGLALFIWKYFLPDSFAMAGIRLTPVVIFIGLSALLKMIVAKKRFNTFLQKYVMRGRTTQEVFVALVHELFPWALVVWLLANFAAVVFPVRTGVRESLLDVTIATAIIALLWFFVRGEGDHGAFIPKKHGARYHLVAIGVLGSVIIGYALYGVVAPWVWWVAVPLTAMVSALMVYMVGYYHDLMNT